MQVTSGWWTPSEVADELRISVKLSDEDRENRAIEFLKSQGCISKAHDVKEWAVRGETLWYWSASGKHKTRHMRAKAVSTTGGADIDPENADGEAKAIHDGMDADFEAIAGTVGMNAKPEAIVTMTPKERAAQRKQETNEKKAKKAEASRAAFE